MSFRTLPIPAGGPADSSVQGIVYPQLGTTCSIKQHLVAYSLHGH